LSVIPSFRIKYKEKRVKIKAGNPAFITYY
jgi:hypothetical protein